MLLSDGGLFFPLNSQMKIYVPRDRELVRLSVCVCVCELKSIGERERVAVVHHSCSVLRRPAQGRVTQSRTERMPMCHSCGHLHGKPGFSRGTRRCALRARTERGVSVSTMHDHILCLGLSTHVPWVHVTPRWRWRWRWWCWCLISWPVSCEVILFCLIVNKSQKKSPKPTMRWCNSEWLTWPRVLPDALQ